MRCFLLFLLLSATLRLPGQTPINPFCGTPDALPETVQQALRSLSSTATPAAARTATLREIRLAFDVRYATLQAFGGDEDQVRTLIYQRVAALSEQFEKDINLRVSVSYIHCWKTPDGYDAQSIFTALQSSRDYWLRQMGQVPRDAVVLYDHALPGAAGYAYSFTTCNVGQSYLAVNSLQTPARQYDNLLAHELGHLLGVPHTHACGWPTGPLDSCYQAEGPCAAPTFMSVQRVGYLMSYCSLEGRAFHPQAKALIGRLSAQACWGGVTSPPFAPTPVAPAQRANVLGQGVYVRAEAPAGAKQYQWEMATDSLFQRNRRTWSSKIPLQPLYGLAANTRYFWRVQASNEFGKSAWSTVSTFQTGNAAASTMPAPVSPLSHDAGSFPQLRFRRVPGALAYRVRVYDAQGNLFWQEITADTMLTLPTTPASPQEQAWTVSVFTLNDGSLVNGTEAPLQGYVTPARSAPLFPQTEVANSPLGVLLRTSATTDSVCYAVQWSNREDFGTVLAERKGVIPTAAFHGLSWMMEKTYGLATPALPAGQYYGRVQQGMCGQNGTWTAFGPVLVRSEAQYTVFHPANSPLPPGQVNDVAVHPLTQEKWFATSEGVVRTANGSQWSTYTLQNTQGQLPQKVAALAFDQAGNVWTANFQYGISRFDGRRWVLFPLGFDVPEHLRGSVRRVVPDEAGGVFFSWGPTQVWHYQPATQALRLLLDGASEEHGTIEHLQRDGDGKLWMIFSKGVWVYDGKMTQRNGPTTALWARAQPQAKPLLWGKNALVLAARDGLLAWENNAWTHLPAPLAGNFQAIARRDSTLWLVGEQQWVGYHTGRKTWTVLPPFGPATSAALDTAGYLWAAHQPSALVYRVHLNALRAAQTIDMALPATLVVGEAAPRVLATATSGLPVHLTLTPTSATVAPNGLLTVKTTGKVTVQATQAGNERFLSALPVTKTICVIPARPTVRRDSVQGALLNSSSPQNNQWYRNGTPIAGATQPTLRATEEGYYAVLVTNQDGCPSSAPSPTVEVRFNMAQTLRFVFIAPKTVGDAPFEVMVTTNSGLPVTLSVTSGPAVLAGASTLRLTGSGRVTLRAQQAGNWQYLPATATYDFCVLPPTPTITQDPNFPRFLRSNAQSGNQWLLNDTLVRGANEPTYWANRDGRYSLVLLNKDNCPDSRPSPSVVVAKQPQTVQLSAVTPVVAPGTVTLRAKASSGLPITFLITNGAVQQRDSQLQVLAPGRVVYKAIQAGNDRFQYAEALGSLCALPPTPSIRRDTAQARLLYSTVAAVSEWARNDSILRSVQTPYLMTEATGWYQVRTLNTDGCPPSAWSPAIFVGGPSQERSESDGPPSVYVQITPNPAHSLITVRSHAPIAHLGIWNRQGQLVQAQRFVQPEILVQWSVEKLPAGLYQCRVTGTDGAIKQVVFVKF